MMVSFLKKIVIFIFFTACAWAGYGFMFPAYYFPIQDENASAHKPVRQVMPKDAAAQDYGKFLGAVDSKKIFAAPAPKTEKAPVRKNKEAEDLIKNLNLVGIIAGTPPRAIIENKKNNQSFYLSPGSELAEGIVVDNIGSGSVSLSCQGHKFELNL